MDSKMQEAYQEFMLGKRTKNKDNSSENVSTPPIRAKSKMSVNTKYNDGNSNSRRKKGYRAILKALQGRLETWNDTNKQMKSVLDSISNLRDRIYWESNRLQSTSVINQERKSSWRNCGFRSVGRNFLLNEDIDLALNHDILQHERMLSLLRGLMASLAQNVDEIGRRLDKWMHVSLSEFLPTPPQYQQLSDMDEIVTTEKTITEWTKEQNIIEDARGVYSLIALDLFRKQTLSKRIFDSCHDTILITRSDILSSSSSRKSDPRDVVKKACQEWSSADRKNLTQNLIQNFLLLS